MKASALRFLVCPNCKDDFELAVDRHEGSEILDGCLSCRTCGASYPILRGIPRFVQHGSYASSFGRQWNWFKTVQLDSLSGLDESERMLMATTGWTAADLGGRLVLDAGVGAGRFAEIAAKLGGEVVGIDLTTAIEAAYANIGRHPHVHLIQADIFAMPFRPASFDFAYSIGVLHHTHDTRAAFTRVADVVKDGGGLAVYLYHRYGVTHHASNLIRIVTSRLPTRLMFALSTIAIPLYYVYKVPVLGSVLQLLFPISQHRRWRWRWLDTFDWYTPKFQWKFLYPEVFRWFRENGFADLEIFDEPIRMRGTKRHAGQVSPWTAQPAEAADTTARPALAPCPEPR
jgi:SAM-dependent methyltransferase